MLAILRPKYSPPATSDPKGLRDIIPTGAYHHLYIHMITYRSLYMSLPPTHLWNLWRLYRPT